MDCIRPLYVGVNQGPIALETFIATNSIQPPQSWSRWSFGSFHSTYCHFNPTDFRAHFKSYTVVSNKLSNDETNLHLRKYTILDKKKEIGVCVVCRTRTSVRCTWARDDWVKRHRICCKNISLHFSFHSPQITLVANKTNLSCHKSESAHLLC